MLDHNFMCFLNDTNCSFFEDLIKSKLDIIRKYYDIYNLLNYSFLSFKKSKKDEQQAELARIKLLDIIDENSDQILSKLERNYNNNDINTYHKYHNIDSLYKKLIEIIKDYINIYLKFIDPLFFNTNSNFQALCKNTIISLDEENNVSSFEFESPRFKVTIKIEQTLINHGVPDNAVTSLIDYITGVKANKEYMVFIDIDIFNNYTNTKYHYSFTNDECDIEDDVMKIQFCDVAYNIIIYIKNIIINLIELIFYSKIRIDEDEKIKIITTEKLEQWYYHHYPKETT